MATNVTRRLEQQRNSLEMQSFKEKVNALLTFANAPEIEYHIVKDLSRKINLPFYKDTAGRGTQTKMSTDAIVKGYCKICSDYYKKYKDDKFIEDLFKHLSEQQNQYFRKLSRRTKEQNHKKSTKNKYGVWEHPIPLKYSRDILIGYIKSDDQIKINAYIDFLWTNTYQVFLGKEWDNKLRTCALTDTMPAGWNWEEPSNNNVFQRYIVAEIPEEEYMVTHQPKIMV